MNKREREIRDALIAPINALFQRWESLSPVTRAPSPQSTAGTPATSRATVRGRARAKRELPRGIRRRGSGYVAYLTHADGSTERRSIGNVTLKMAEQQRQIWMREIAEGRYIKKVPRVERVLFSAIADKALEYGKTYKRSWDTDASRIKRMKDWWGRRFADSITTQEINQKLFENVSPRGLCWMETTSNEYRTLLSSIYNREINSDEPRLAVIRQPRRIATS